MDGKRQKTDEQVSFPAKGRGEAPQGAGEGTEPPKAKREAESPALPEHLMEEVCERENLKKALKRVKSNKGSPGIDGMNHYVVDIDLEKFFDRVNHDIL